MAARDPEDNSADLALENGDQVLVRIGQDGPFVRARVISRRDGEVRIESLSKALPVVELKEL